MTESTSAQSATTATETQARGFRKTREGYVVSDKMNKTVTVEVEDRILHARYGKTIRRTKKVKAHDEANEVGIGDSVRRSGEWT